MPQEFVNWSAVITDASCFILLDKIEALPLLPKLFPHVITTPEIVAEFGKQLPAWVEIKTVLDQSLQLLFEEEVDKGEASAIALAKEIPFALLIIDDLKGRKLAKQLQLMHTGSPGMLLLAKQKGIIHLLRPYFEKICLTNFRVSPELLDNLLQTAGE